MSFIIFPHRRLRAADLATEGLKMPAKQHPRSRLPLN
jgi:hypothetical protein